MLGPNEGVELEARGSRMRFVATASSTDGTFSLMERELPAGGRMPPPHHHVRAEEALYVLEGEVEILLGEERVRSGARSFVLLPRGTAHTFGNAGPGPARVLVLHAPAMDAYFRELQDLWAKPTPPSSNAEIALMRRHGTEPVRGG